MSDSPDSPGSPSSPPLSSSSSSLTLMQLSQNTALRAITESEMTLDRTARRKLKKKRKQVAVGKGSEQDFYDIYGQNARADLTLKLEEYFKHGRTKLRSKDVQVLVQWVLAEETSPKWVFVKNKPLVRSVVVLLVDGLSHGIYTRYAHCFTRLQQFTQLCTPTAVPITVKGSSFSAHSVLLDYIMVPRNNRDKPLGQQRPQLQQQPVKRQRSAENEAGGQTASKSEKKQDDDEEEEEQERKKAEDRKKKMATEEKQDGDQSSSDSEMEEGEVDRRVSPLSLILTPLQLADNKYPHVGEADYLHSCNHHHLTRKQIDALLSQQQTTLPPCIHTHPCVHDFTQLHTWRQVRQQSHTQQQSGHKSNTSATAEQAEQADTKHTQLQPRDKKQKKNKKRSAADAEHNDEEEKKAEPEEEAEEEQQHKNSVSAEYAPAVYAIDCEMCYTASGLELTRVTLIDSHHAVLLDSLVRPEAQITDYNTRYSGITQEMLASCTVTLPQVRAALLARIHADDILVGHSLENDLRALHIIHTRIIDTALLFRHPRGAPHKSALRYLATKHLQQTIQTGQHDSTEDARCTLRLAQLKFKYGADYGDAAANDQQPLIDLLHVHQQVTAVCASPNAIKAVLNCCKPESQATTICLPAATDQQITDKAIKQINKANHHLMLVQYSHLLSTLHQVEADKKAALPITTSATSTSTVAASSTLATPTRTHNASSHSTSTPSSTSNGSPSASSSSSPASATTTTGFPSIFSFEPNELVQRALEPRVVSCCMHLDLLMSNVCAALPVNTLCMVLSGDPSAAVIKRLQEKRVMKARTGDTSVSLMDDIELNQAVADLQAGIGFFTIKQ